jgi:5-methylcytosine-specific restriction endonuclease McrA
MTYIIKRYRPVYYVPPEKREQPISPDSTFYNSKLWRDTRKVYLFSNPACISCGVNGEVIDHIIPIQQGGAKLDFRNLQTMCHSCHNRKRTTTDKRKVVAYDYNEYGDKIPKNHKK